MTAAARALAFSFAAALCACQQPGSPRAAAPSPPPDAISLGVRLLSAGQPEMALDAFNRAISDDGVTAEALTGLGVAYLRLGRRGQARKVLKSAVTRDPNLAIARNNFGVALYDSGEFAAALSEFERAFALTNGTDRSIETNIGMAELALTRAASDRAAIVEPEFDVIQYGHGVYRLEERLAVPGAPSEESPS